MYEAGVGGPRHLFKKNLQLRTFFFIAFRERGSERDRDKERGRERH